MKNFEFSILGKFREILVHIFIIWAVLWGVRSTLLKYRSQYSDPKKDLKMNTICQESGAPTYCRIPEDQQFSQFMWFVTDGWPYYFADDMFKNFTKGSVTFQIDVDVGTRYSHALYTSFLNGQPPTNLKGDAIQGDNLLEAIYRSGNFKIDYIGPKWSFLAMVPERNYPYLISKLDLREEPLVHFYHSYPFFFEGEDARQEFYGEIFPRLYTEKRSLISHSAISDHQQHGDYKYPSQNFRTTRKIGKNTAADFNELKMFMDKHYPEALLIISSDHGHDEKVSGEYRLHGSGRNGNIGFLMMYNRKRLAQVEVSKLSVVDFLPTIAKYLKGVDIPFNSIGVSRARYGPQVSIGEIRAAKQNLAQLSQLAEFKGLSGVSAIRMRYLLGMKEAPDVKGRLNQYREIVAANEEIKANLFERTSYSIALLAWSAAALVLLLWSLLIYYTTFTANAGSTARFLSGGVTNEGFVQQPTYVWTVSGGDDMDPTVQSIDEESELAAENGQFVGLPPSAAGAGADGSSAGGGMAVMPAHPPGAAGIAGYAPLQTSEPAQPILLQQGQPSMTLRESFVDAVTFIFRFYRAFFRIAGPYFGYLVIAYVGPLFGLFFRAEGFGAPWKSGMAMGIHAEVLTVTCMRLASPHKARLAALFSFELLAVGAYCVKKVFAGSLAAVREVPASSVPLLTSLATLGFGYCLLTFVKESSAIPSVWESGQIKRQMSLDPSNMPPRHTGPVRKAANAEAGYLKPSERRKPAARRHALGYFRFRPSVSSRFLVLIAILLVGLYDMTSGIKSLYMHDLGLHYVGLVCYVTIVFLMLLSFTSHNRNSLLPAALAILQWMLFNPYPAKRIYLLIFVAQYTIVAYPSLGECLFRTDIGQQGVFRSEPGEEVRTVQHAGAAVLPLARGGSQTVLDTAVPIPGGANLDATSVADTTAADNIDTGPRVEKSLSDVLPRTLANVVSSGEFGNILNVAPDVESRLFGVEILSSQLRTGKALLIEHAVAVLLAFTNPLRFLTLLFGEPFDANFEPNAGLVAQANLNRLANLSGLLMGLSKYGPLILAASFCTVFGWLHHASCALPASPAGMGPGAGEKSRSRGVFRFLGVLGSGIKYALHSLSLTTFTISLAFSGSLLAFSSLLLSRTKKHSFVEALVAVVVYGVLLAFIEICALLRVLLHDAFAILARPLRARRQRKKPPLPRARGAAAPAPARNKEPDAGSPSPRPLGGSTSRRRG